MYHACLDHEESYDGERTCPAVAELLLQHGASIHGKILIYVAARGFVETMRILLRFGGDARFHDVEGWTVLHAASRHKVDIVNMLIEHGGDANAQDRRGVTPLMNACDVDVASALLRHGANIDAKASFGRNLLNVDEYVRFLGEGLGRTAASGAGQKLLALFAAFRAAGSWKRYADEPRLQLVVLRRLVARGRATAPRGDVLERLFHPSRLPDALCWEILRFWKTERDLDR